VETTAVESMREVACFRFLEEARPELAQVIAALRHSGIPEISYSSAPSLFGKLMTERMVRK
jgi:sirohydrochlorin ferrochelatase